MNGMDTIQIQNRRRLEPIHDLDLKPFLRAEELEDISLYWAPVDTFPMNFRLRSWWMTFLTRFKEVMAKQSLRQENFLQFKTIAVEKPDRFMAMASEFVPLTGISVKPGETIPGIPDLEEVKKAVYREGFRIEKYVADYAYWFINKQDQKQRQQFFGMGGMTFLWLKEDPAAKPPDLKLPLAARRLMEAHGTDIEGRLRGTYAMQESFLQKSKNVFGQSIADDPSFKGLPFVLPLLSSRYFFDAGPERRQEWFEVFEGYCTESKEDKGVLLALKTPCFDEQLAPLLKQMRADGVEYPL
jgi:hypothetical protein